MALRQLALALGTLALLFVTACGGTQPGKLDTDSAAMPWEAPDEADIVDADEEPDPEFPVPDLPLDDDDDDGATTEEPTAASTPAPADGAKKPADGAKKAADGAKASPKTKAP